VCGNVYTVLEAPARGLDGAADGVVGSVAGVMAADDGFCDAAVFVASVPDDLDASQAATPAITATTSTIAVTMTAVARLFGGSGW